jgi:hypothetical protein
VKAARAARLPEGSPAVEDIVTLSTLYLAGEELEPTVAAFRTQAHVSILFRAPSVMDHL